MDNFGEGHPCAGKDCRNCETCIFDRDLFVGGVMPNERIKEENNTLNKNMCNFKTCNECRYLKRMFEGCGQGRFDAACEAVTYEAFGISRPRRIDYNLDYDSTIIAPSWCPEKNKQLTLPQKSTVTRPIPQMTGPQPSSSTAISYSDRRERMKNLRKHIEWDDIEEGKVYVIPKILSQARKIVKVITKTQMSCVCHEISEITGNEFTYNCMVYPSDLEAVFINELHNF